MLKQRFFKLIAILLAVCLLLSGCTIGSLGPDNLIHPPKPYGENEGLQDALEAAVKGNIILKSPKTGDYRSAFVLYDIDNDGEAEAVTFYKLQSDDSAIHMNILDRQNKKWKSVCDIVGSGSDVDRVSFGDMNGDKIPEIIVGWDLFESKEKKLLSVYRCSVGNHSFSLKEIVKESYTEMKPLDMTGSGKTEIMLTLLDSTNNPPTAVAKLLQMGADGKIRVIGQTNLDGNVSSYASVQYESAKENKGARVYLDGNKGENSMITELVYWDKGEKALKSPLLDPKTSSTVLTARSLRITSRDINNDGIIEIPGQVEMAGINYKKVPTKNSNEDKLYLTKWSQLAGTKLTPVLYSVINSSQSYMFLLPDKWADKVTVVSSNDDKTWIFYEWNFDKSCLGDELLDIKTVSYTEWNEKPEQNYQFIRQNGNTVYIAKIPNNKNELVIPINEVKSDFIVNYY